VVALPENASFKLTGGLRSSDGLLALLIVGLVVVVLLVVVVFLVVVVLLVVVVFLVVVVLAVVFGLVVLFLLGVISVVVVISLVDVETAVEGEKFNCIGGLVNRLILFTCFLDGNNSFLAVCGFFAAVISVAGLAAKSLLTGL